jgi:hypothetical protein
VDVALVEELAADGLAGAALEEDVVGDDDGGAAVDLQDLTCWTKLSCLLLVVVQKSGGCR